MALNRLCFISTHLLFLSHMAHSFILLTANMDDVKKVARKFVSDSLAEKIAEFVAKATEQMVDKVSEENDKNDDVQYLSENNDLQNIERQDTTPTYEASRKEENYETKESSAEQYRGQTINWEKDGKRITYDYKYLQTANRKVPEVKYEENDESPKIDYDQQKEYDQQKADYEQSKLEQKAKIEELRKKDYEQQQIIYEQQTEPDKVQDQKQNYQINYEQPNNEPRMKQQINFYQQTSKSKRPRQKKRNQRQKQRDNKITKNIPSTMLYNEALRMGDKGHRLVDFNPTEIVNLTPPSLQGFNIERTLSTAKERVEFDQYDNPNYPKSAFVATSGPVALPKIHMRSLWWEKEMAKA